MTLRQGLALTGMISFGFAYLSVWFFWIYDIPFLDALSFVLGAWPRILMLVFIHVVAGLTLIDAWMFIRRYAAFFRQWRGNRGEQ